MKRQQLNNFSYRFFFFLALKSLAVDLQKTADFSPLFTAGIPITPCMFGTPVKGFWEWVRVPFVTTHKADYHDCVYDVFSCQGI